MRGAKAAKSAVATKKPTKSPRKKRSKLGALGYKYGRQVADVQKKMDAAIKKACATAGVVDVADFLVGVSVAGPPEIREQLLRAMAAAMATDSSYGSASIRDAVELAVRRLKGGEQP